MEMVHHWEKYVNEYELIYKNKEYIQYVKNIFNATDYGDDLCLQAIGQMFNIRISVIYPLQGIMSMNHSASLDIVLIHNGAEGRMGHWTATGKNNKYYY